MFTRSLRTLSLLAITAAATSIQTSHATEVELIDIDFNDTQNYHPPALGNGPASRSTMSHITLGDPEVVPHFLGHFGRKLRFDGADHTRIALYNMPEAADATSYYMTFDLMIDPTGPGPFTIDLLAPDKRSIWFDTEIERIWLIFPDSGNTNLGSFTPGEVTKIAVRMNRETDEFFFWVNGTLRHHGTGSDDWTQELRQIGFGSPFTQEDNMRATVDNVVVTAELPCAADIDNNGDVGLSDMITVLAGWGDCDPGCQSDIQNDGATDLDDMLIVLANWGACG